jgi:hypothetical protein
MHDTSTMMKASRRIPLLLAASLALLFPSCTQLLGPLLSAPRTLLSLPARAMRFGENTAPPEIRALDHGIVGVQNAPRYPVAPPKSERAIASETASALQPPG